MAVSGDDCPVCLLYDRTAVAAALLEDLAGVAQQMGGVPVGLGGTIALARRRLEQARQMILPAAQMAPGQGVAELGARLQHLHGFLGGGWLSPQDIAVAATEARWCRQRAHSIARAFFSGGRVA